MYTAKFKRYQMQAFNREEYHGLKREIFGNQVYWVELTNPTPYIIDAGAYIGMSTLYFKDIYPDAQILAIEPHPEAYSLLEQNVWQNGLKNVWTLEAALAAEVGTRDLFFDASDDTWYSVAGFHETAWDGTQTSQSVSVNCVTLPEILTDDRAVDLLKLDIEGAEHEVLFGSKAQLKKVMNLIVEHHPARGEHWQDMAAFLENSGFQVMARKGERRADPHRKTGGLVMLYARRR